MNRRHFVFGSLPAAALAQNRQASRKILIILVDGFAMDYLEASDMPNLKRMGQEGGLKAGRCVIPSVTNVNNASVVTGSFPSEHGITTNYQYDRRTKTSSEMESAEFLLKPTIFEKAKKLGMRTALVSSKDKVRTLCSRGADIVLSAEKPALEWIERIGQKEKMYSADVNYWTFRAARQILKSDSVDLMYLSTTDYMMHTYAPGESPSLEHLHRLDMLLADIADDHPQIEIYLTADHGMNAKREGINPALILRGKSVSAEAIPIIRDAHKIHHNNLGGACYVYLDRISDKSRATEILTQTEGVEEVFDAKRAASEFHLYPDRIGDLFVLAKKDYVFGELEKSRESVEVRSHGSRHESRIPLLVYGRKVDMNQYTYNLDLTRNLHLKG
jgi:phosphonoacetate hydrolase